MAQNSLIRWKLNLILRLVKKEHKIFYCHPSSPYQKGSCEVNHELLRRILPKGTSFDDLTQKNINLMMSHINSYKKKKTEQCVTIHSVQ